MDDLLRVKKSFDSMIHLRDMGADFIENAVGPEREYAAVPQESFASQVFLCTPEIRLFSESHARERGDAGMVLDSLANLYVPVPGFRARGSDTIGDEIPLHRKVIPGPERFDKFPPGTDEMISRHDMDHGITVLSLQGHCRQADRSSGISAQWFYDRSFLARVHAREFFEFLGYDEHALLMSAVRLYAFDGLDEQRGIIENRKELFGEIRLAHGPESQPFAACQYYGEFLNGVSPLI